MTDNKFDLRDFRNALGQFPTGVTVITALDTKGEPIGCTASSFNSVSMDPALVLWSVDKGAFSADIFANIKYFAVNVLSESQVATSNRFAGRGEDKFKGVVYQDGLGGAPLLEGCGAQFECETWNVYEGGDHLIIVGKVAKYQYDSTLTPLVFSRGSYAITGQHPSANTQYTEKGGTNEFLNNYLPYLLNVTIAKLRIGFYQELAEGGDVTPEQWRIMTLLSPSPIHGVADLSKLVLQPFDELTSALDVLKDKEFIQYHQDKLCLSLKGVDVQQKLIAIAIKHERALLKGLTKEQIIGLKSVLKTLGSVEL
ncbi:MAG: flavin reductase [Litorilituus sp.]|nr:flavin reductase [Litorilituus sp.]